MPASKTICLGLLCIVFAVPLFAQVSPAEKTLLYAILKEDLEEDFGQLLEAEQMLEDIELPADIIPSAALGYKVKEGQKKGLIPPSISLQTIYNKDAYRDSLNIPSLYNRMQIQTGAHIAGIPIKASARAILADREIQTQLSSFSLDFDANTFLQQFRVNPNEWVKPTSLLESPTIALDDWSAFTEEELAILKNELKYQLYLKVVNHPKFVDWLTEKEAIEGAIGQQSSQLKDTLLRQQEGAMGKFKEEKENINQEKEEIIKEMNAFKDEANHYQEEVVDKADALETEIKQRQKALRDKKEKAEAFVKLYGETWESRKAYFGDSLHVIKEKLSIYKDRLKHFRNPENIRQAILADKSQSLATRILAATKQFKLGQSVVEDSWYTAHNLPINGVQYHFKGARAFGGFAYGKQVYNTSFSPIWASKLFNQVAGGRVFFAKAGYFFGDNTSSIDYTFINVKNEGNLAQGTFISPENNAVFSLTGQGKIQEHLYLKSSFNFSRNRWGDTDLAKSNKVNGTNTAGELTLSGSAFSNHLNIEAGYFYVGADFIAAANPFIQNNRHGLVAKLKGKLGTKLQLAGEAKLGKTIEEAYLEGHQKNIQLLGSFNWQASKSLSINGQIAPNTFKHFGTGDVVVSNANMLYNLQLLSRYKVQQATFLASAGLTNFNNRLSTYDTTFVNQSNYIFTQESLIFPNQSAISILLMAGFNSEENDMGNGASCFSQIDYSLQKNNWTMQAGTQVLKDAFTPDWYYGITNFSTIQLNKQLSLSVDISYQFPFKRSQQTSTRFWGSIEFSKQF